MKQGGARCNSPIVCTALTLALLGASSTILQKKHASELSQLQVSAEMASQAAEAKQAHMETEKAAMHATILELKDQILRMQKKHAAEMSQLQVSAETAVQAANAKRALMEQQMLELKEQQRGHAATSREQTSSAVPFQLENRRRTQATTELLCPVVEGNKDPHLSFAHGGRADFRGRNGRDLSRPLHPLQSLQAKHQSLAPRRVGLCTASSPRRALLSTSRLRFARAPWHRCRLTPLTECPLPPPGRRLGTY